MTDDLLNRLRGLACRECGFSTHNHFDKAVDEIERLRKLVTTWIICAERLVESNEGEQYEKALNFYRDCQRIANETC